MKDSQRKEIIQLSDRFSAIQQAVATVHGEESAFAAASAAWLMAIECAIAWVLERAAEGESISSLRREVQELLQSYHSELCKYFSVDQQQAFRLATHFHELLKDLADEK